MSVSGKNVTHRNWIDTLSDIWKNHPVARIQKLADKRYGIKQKLVSLLRSSSALGAGLDPLLSSTFGERYQREDGNHGDPLLSSCGIILRFYPIFHGALFSVAVLKFWTDIEKAKLRNKLYSIHFNGFAELVENRNNFGYNELQDIQVENSDIQVDNRDNSTHKPSIMNFKIFSDKSAGNTESGFDNDEEPYEEEHFAHIIDLDKVTERDRPPFLNITESQLPSIKLPKSVEQQLDYYLAETTIEKIWESFESYKIVNSDDELYTRKSRGSLYFLSRETTRVFCATAEYRDNIPCSIY
uniref:Uncharacterized protein n=1 Tax=Rhizophagus irregularis (strain DAOM 181602 / DAOM 197198 / MUCL 43194) TaxID=747089 RepID=U9UMU4_RHIID